MGFSRQEYWSGLPVPSPGDLPDPEIEPASPALAGRFLTTERPVGEAGLQTAMSVKSAKYCGEETEDTNGVIAEQQTDQGIREGFPEEVIF